MKWNVFAEWQRVGKSSVNAAYSGHKPTAKNQGGKKMKVYEVVSRYIDGRKDTFCLNEIESENIPCNTFTSLKTRDIYHDYFTSKEDAEKFIEDSKKGLI